MSLDGCGGSMTSRIYMTHIFVFVFLNAIDPSKEKCHDLLDMDDWANKENLKDTFSLMTTEDPKHIVNCSLEAECLKKEGKGIGCELLQDCPKKKIPTLTSPECNGNISQVNIYHFMCLMAKAFEHPLEGCEYNTMCKIYPKIPSPSDLTTTPRTTTPRTTTRTTPSTTTPRTTTPRTTTPTTTTPTTTTPRTTTRTTPSTTTPRTTTPRTTTPRTTTPTTTTPRTTKRTTPSTTTQRTTPSTTTPTTALPETTTVLPSPTIATLKLTATKLAPESSFPQVGNNETSNSSKILDEKQKETDKLKMLLWLSLVLHVIVPLAVYLYMRHRWMRDRMRDRMHSSLTHVSNGNLTGEPPKKESDATPGSLDAVDAENTHLLKRVKHSDDAILNCVSSEDDTQL